MKITQQTKVIWFQKKGFVMSMKEDFFQLLENDRSFADALLSGLEGQDTIAVKDFLAVLPQVISEIIAEERMDAQMQIAKGIAHNFNNIMVGAHGYAQIIQKESSDENIAQQAGHIVDSIERAKDLIGQLSRAVDGMGGSLYPVKINEVAKEMEAALFRFEYEGKIRVGCDPVYASIRTELSETPAIRGTLEGVRMIIANLFRNAAESLRSEGGVISISTSLANDFVRLCVSDNGIGMDARTRQRVFEPFFTTKNDVGSGLGLSVVFSTVRRWGGTIDVKSELGCGSSFVVNFSVYKE